MYWRPGCGYCHSLLRSLERFEVPHDRVNIWENPDAAAFVRSVARGNETVPTVAIGDTALVNPTMYDVMETLAGVAPDEVPTEYRAR